jgi:glycosyltransferase involved in cell wall biosynthesis
MKRILLISYHFQKKEDIAAVRTGGLAKYLKSSGWEISVICGDKGKPDQFEIFEITIDNEITKWKKALGLKNDISFRKQIGIPTYKGKETVIDSILNLWEEIFTYPDAYKTWIDPAIEKGKELIKNKKFHAIISSSGPPSVNIVAASLASEFNIPWIADFRDLWIQNHYYHYSKIRKYFERRLELKTLAKANILTTISQPLADKLRELHQNKKIIIIPNGFDPNQVNQGTPLKDKFTITYTGILYRGRRDPELLLKTIKSLIDERIIDPESIECEFYGSDDDWLIRDIKKYQLENIVKVYGRISRDSSIQKQRQSQILLLLTWNDPEEKGVYTGKLFDYLAARRPILSLGYTDGGVVKELLDQTQAGVHCANKTELRDYLLNAYREFRELGAVQYHGINEEIMKYSHIEMARKFAKVLEEVTASPAE